MMQRPSASSVLQLPLILVSHLCFFGLLGGFFFLLFFLFISHFFSLFSATTFLWNPHLSLYLLFLYRPRLGFDGSWLPPSWTWGAAILPDCASDLLPLRRTNQRWWERAWSIGVWEPET